MIVILCYALKQIKYKALAVYKSCIVKLINIHPQIFTLHFTLSDGAFCYMFCKLRSMPMCPFERISFSWEDIILQTSEKHHNVLTIHSSMSLNINLQQSCSMIILYFFLVPLPQDRQYQPPYSLSHYEPRTRIHQNYYGPISSICDTCQILKALSLQ